MIEKRLYGIFYELFIKQIDDILYSHKIDLPQVISEVLTFYEIFFKRHRVIISINLRKCLQNLWWVYFNMSTLTNHKLSCEYDIVSHKMNENKKWIIYRPWFRFILV